MATGITELRWWILDLCEAKRTQYFMGPKEFSLWEAGIQMRDESYLWNVLVVYKHSLCCVPGCAWHWGLEVNMTEPLLKLSQEWWQKQGSVIQSDKDYDREWGTSTMKVQRLTRYLSAGKSPHGQGSQGKGQNTRKKGHCLGRSLISPFVSCQEMNLQNKTKIKILAL